MIVVKELPDPFLMNSGKHVESIEDWNIRRNEIREQILEIEYGTMPGAPDVITPEIKERKDVDGEVFYEKVHLTFTPEKNHPDITCGVDVHIHYPPTECIEERKESISDFGKEGLPCVIVVGTSPAFEMSEAGYLVVGFENDQLDPMEMGNPILGPVRKAYERLEPGKYSWGSISVWAWGAMRVLDYVLSRKDVDPHKIIITGHSRNGKTALLAGALDERFSLVCPAGSGCGDAVSYLVFGEGAETLAALTDRRRWWGWMHRDFEQYAYEFRGESKKKLPLDQHFVMGLIAPRPLLRTEGKEDYWANPIGTSAAFLATEPIYEFLGVSNRNQCFFRSGGHYQGHEDWMALRSFADWHFFGIPQERILKDIAFREGEVPELFSWKCPVHNVK